jgi:hypothetical protein
VSEKAGYRQLIMDNGKRRFAMWNNDGCMKRKLLVATLGLVIVLLISSLGCLYRYHSAACKQRGDAYSARVEKLRREAHETLKIGTKKDAVIRFFAENGIPVTFYKGEAEGTIYTTGCAPSGCGSDAALLGLRVNVDEAGTVVSEPVVGAIYANCL